MESACIIRIDVRWLMGTLTPDHVTICNFLVDQRELFQKVFEGTLVVAEAAKLLTLRHVAVDGTKMKRAPARIRPSGKRRCRSNWPPRTTRSFVSRASA